MAEKKKSELVEKQLRLMWGNPDELPVIYANQLQVTHAGGTEFHITFGHLTPPLTHGLSIDEIPDKLNIKPVAKIVVSPDVMKEFVKVLAENYEDFESKKGQKGEK